MMIHHSIGFKPDHQQYNKASAPIRAAAAELWDPNDAPAEIDRVIRECVIKKKPVYIFFPIDLTSAEVSAGLLDKKIDLSYPVNKENEDAAVGEIVKAFENSKHPAIFVDHLVNHRAEMEVKTLVDSLRIPIYASQMSKGLIDEDKPYYVGLYTGKVSFPGIQAAAETHDFVLGLGWFPCDTNTSFFSRNIPDEKRIDCLDDHVVVSIRVFPPQTHDVSYPHLLTTTQVKGKRLENVYLQPLIARLLKTTLKVPDPALYKKPEIGSRPQGTDQDADKITHSWFWPNLSKFLRPNDIVIGETGTTNFGLADTTFKPNTKYVIIPGN